MNGFRFFTRCLAHTFRRASRWRAQLIGQLQKFENVQNALYYRGFARAGAARYDVHAGIKAVRHGFALLFVQFYAAHFFKLIDLFRKIHFDVAVRRFQKRKSSCNRFFGKVAFVKHIKARVIDDVVFDFRQENKVFDIALHLFKISFVKSQKG